MITSHDHVIRRLSELKCEKKIKQLPLTYLSGRSKICRGDRRALRWILMRKGPIKIN